MTSKVHSSSIHPGVLQVLAEVGASPYAVPSQEQWDQLLLKLGRVNEARRAPSGQWSSVRLQRPEANDFLANLSHELRTPLAVVMGGLQLLLEAGLDTQQLQILRAAHESGRSLVRIIDQLLDYSNLKLRQGGLLYDSFNLKKLLEEIIFEHESRANQAGLGLTHDLDLHLPRWVTGDRARVGQILGLLLDNAIRFSESGSVDFRAELAQPGQDPLLLRFTISDSGPGLDQTTINDLFSPFHQIDCSPARKHTGVGLSLAIAKELVELMDGEVSVDSQIGHGTTLSFTIRLEASSMKNSSMPPPFVRRVPPRPAGAGPAIVLLAEDSEFNRMLVSRVLAPLGVRLVCALNGNEALEFLKSECVDLVLMDCQMPDLDGYEATRRLRALDAPIRNVPVVALTANALYGDRERCLLAGMDSYIKKPFVLEELRAEVERWLPSRPDEESPNNRTASKRPTVKADTSTAKATPDSETLDIARLHELAQQAGTNSIVVELSFIFLEDVATRLEALGEALRSDERDDLERSAHAIKGASSCFGAGNMAKLAERLEKSAKSSHNLEPLLKELQTEFSEVRSILEHKVLDNAQRLKTRETA